MARVPLPSKLVLREGRPFVFRFLFVAVAVVLWGVALSTLPSLLDLLVHPGNLLRVFGAVGAMGGAGVMLWRRQSFRPFELAVGRDGVRLTIQGTKAVLTVSDFELDRVRERVSLGAAYPDEPDHPIPGVYGHRAGVALDRIEAALAPRRNRAPEDLLDAPTFADVRARSLALFPEAVPFRSAGGNLPRESADEMLADLASGREDLVAAAVAVAARDREIGRARIETVARDCLDPGFAALLRAIGENDPEIEAVYASHRIAPPDPTKSGWFVFAELAVVTACTMVVLRATPGEHVVKSIGSVLMLSILRTVLGVRIPRRWHGYVLPGLVAAVATAMAAVDPRHARPSASVPVGIFCAFWVTVAIRDAIVDALAARRRRPSESARVRIAALAAEPPAEATITSTVEGETRTRRNGTG